MHKFQKLFAIFITAIIIFSISACQVTPPTDPSGTSGGTEQPTEKTDNWEYDPSQDNDDGYFGGSRKLSMATGVTGGAPMAMEAAMAPTGGNIGFSVGGAKDIGNFRENIENNFLPIPTDITYEGLFYNYFFETGQKEECKKLFCPSYSTAVSDDPFTNEGEYYLSVGLNSGIKESDFERKKLNIVLVLDISGSMGSAFDQYYYDRFGNKMPAYEEESSSESKSKMEIASKSVVALLDHLEDEDTFGIVLFDDSAYLAKPMTKVKNTDMSAIKDHILEISDRGGTNMEAGMKEGSEMLYEKFLPRGGELNNLNPEEYENRIIFITDAMPNLGDSSDEGLHGTLKKNAKNNIYTTFVGVGVDFNTELIEILTKMRGANYYSVHSEKEFKETMDEGFDYMVTPLVFDLELTLEADGYEIEKVYGSPEADEATGEIMKINTLFPSKSEEGKVKGGIVLLKLNKTSESGKLTLKVSYEDRNGKKDTDQKEITFKEDLNNNYDNSGIRKAIVLTRYANLMKAWTLEGHETYKHPIPLPEPCPIILMERGIYPPEPPHLPPCFNYPTLGEWERQSVPLTVNSNYSRIFNEFAEYLGVEMKLIGDETLQQELDILEKLEEA